MDDKQLQEMLSRIEAPAPSQKAMIDAQRAALDAFGKKNKKFFQGWGFGRRLTGINNNIGRNVMQKRYVAGGLASGVALCALVAVLGMPFINQQAQRISGQTAQFSAVSDNIVSEPSTSDDAGHAMVKAERAITPVQAEPKKKADAGYAPVVTQSAQIALPVSPPAVAAPAREMMAADMAIGGLAASGAPAGAMLKMRAAENMIAPMPAPYEPMPQYYQDQGRDQFAAFSENGYVEVAQQPVSTFSIDVDTASYSFLRRQINAGQLPQANSVRVEELVNYFDYHYPVPASLDAPFTPTVTVIDSPWNAHKKLVHIGIKGYEVSEKPKSNLVFLIDTSGSMNSPDKLPLLKNAFKLLLDNLNPDDTVAIVTYAGSAGVALEPTKASDRTAIANALDNLQSGGGTAGAAGIEQAYALAEQHKIDGGNNRVILATDGDFNVGISDPTQLKDTISRKRDEGVFLSVLGFGQGNYNDAMMQALAQNGNGNAAYIDTLNEARKVLVDEAAKTLITIAKDVKIQVEFNPAAVSEYRLVGYETRHLNREDFNNDKVDAGDIGAGAAVTAIYEVTPAGAPKMVDDLRYGQKTESAAPAADAPKTDANEYGYVKIRYKAPDSNTSKLIETPIRADAAKALADTSDDVRFAVAVAGFGQLVADGKYTGNLSYDQVIDLANGARGKDEFGYRSEFVNMVRLAKELKK